MTTDPPNRPEALQATPEPWALAPDIWIEIPSCPSCGATSFQTIRVESGGDGSRTRKSVCKICGQRCKIIFEPRLPSGGRAAE